ncbi:MAG: hypothetical protein U0793_16360 [Gemmataceae bacterium]
MRSPRPVFPWYILTVIGVTLSITAALVNQRIAQQSLENTRRIQQENYRLMQQQMRLPR